MMSSPGVILPPPDGLRDYAVGLWSWAQEGPCETFLETLIRRLGFGPVEKREFVAGLREILAVPPDVDLLAQGEHFSSPAQGSLALMLVVRGVHQLMVLGKEPAEVPSEIVESIAALRRLEALLDGSAPNTAGRKHLRLYRRTLVSRKLLRDEAPSDARLIQPKLSADSAPAAPAPRGASRPHSKPTSPTPASPVFQEEAQSVSQMMLSAAQEAEGQLNRRSSGGSRVRTHFPTLLYASLGVVILAGIVWMAGGDWGPDVSGPSDISEVPVLSMTRHSTSVHLRVQPGWTSKPLAERKADSEALFARLQDETDGAVVTLTLRDPERVLLGTVTATGVVWEAP